MTAGLKFYQSKTPTSGNLLTEATSLNDIKYIVFTDNAGNNYSIDVGATLQLGYKPNSEEEITHDVTDLYGSLSKVFSFPIGSTEDAKSIFQTELVKTGNVTALTGSNDFTSKVYTKTDADSTFLNKNSATETDVTNLLNKITTADQKPIKASDFQTELVKTGNVTALTGSNDFTSKMYTETDADSTFLKKDATNFDNSKQTDFLTKLGATNGNQLIEKIAEKIVSSHSDTTTTALRSVIENHNEEGLVPSYDTLW